MKDESSCSRMPEQMCSCLAYGKVQAYLIAGHVIENMEEAVWKYHYISLDKSEKRTLCCRGKCRICGGGLCYCLHEPDELCGEDLFLILYRRMFQVTCGYPGMLGNRKFREVFLELFHEEDRPRVQKWMERPENSSHSRMYRTNKTELLKGLQKEAQKEEKRFYSVVHTAVDNERGYYPDPEIKGSFLSLERARDEMEKLIALEEDELDSRYDTRERKTDVWEAYQNGCAVVCFSRIEIISSILQDQPDSAKENAERKCVLRLLDELDAFRREHQDERRHPSDFCMRAMEAIVAKEYGFQNRMDWTDVLREDVESKYHQDLLHGSSKGF